ncbi:hypothetical protein H5410_061996, partial [Solanum commersonii]
MSRDIQWITNTNQRIKSSSSKVTVHFKELGAQKGDHRRPRLSLPNGPTCQFSPLTSKSSPNPPKSKLNTNTMKLKKDTYYPCPRGTQTSPDLAKIGHLMSFALKNDVNRFIIGQKYNIWHNSGKSLPPNHLMVCRVVFWLVEFYRTPSNLGVQMMDKVGLADLFGESPIELL